MPWLAMHITTITAWWTKTRHSSKSLGMSPRFAPTSCDEKIQKLPYLNLLTINKTITWTKHSIALMALDFLHSLAIIAGLLNTVQESFLIKKSSQKQRFGKIRAKIYPIKHLKCTKPACAVLILLSKWSCTCCSCLSPVGWAPWSTIDASSFPGSGIRVPRRF